MRIALFEPDPRICGMTTWLRHTKIGMQTLGHDVNLVSSTLSGKPSSAWGATEAHRSVSWSPDPVDLTVKPDEIYDCLDSYDLTVLSEPRSLKIDSQARKVMAVPEYVLAIENLGRYGGRWTTVLHGRETDYAPKMAPFAARLLSGMPARKVLTHFPPVSAYWNDLELEAAGLPLAHISLDTPEIDSGGGVIGMTGRLVPNKGQHLLPELIARNRLSSAREVQLWGSSSVGPGGNYTYAVFEHFRDAPHAWPCVRWGQTPFGTPEGGDIVTAWPFDLTPPGLTPTHFRGSYMDAGEVCRGMDLHVNLTSSKFTASLTEYSTLEAIEAGCIVAAPDQLLGKHFRGARLNYGETIGQKAACKGDGMDYLGTTLEQALAVSVNPDYRFDIVAANRDALRVHHDPAVFAQKLIDAGMG